MTISDIAMISVLILVTINSAVNQLFIREVRTTIEIMRIEIDNIQKLCKK